MGLHVVKPHFFCPNQNRLNVFIANCRVLRRELGVKLFVALTAQSATSHERPIKERNSAGVECRARLIDQRLGGTLRNKMQQI